MDGEELELKSGSSILLIPDDIPCLKHRRISCYHQHLKNQLVANKELIYPFEHYCSSLVERYRADYQRIISAIDVNLLVSSIKSESLHTFLVATLVSHDKLGISRLDRLLGNKESSKVSSTSPDDDNKIPSSVAQTIITTGNAVLDLEVDVYLVFKENARFILSNYCLDTIVKMLSQAGDRLRQANSPDSSPNSQLTDDSPGEEVDLPQSSDRLTQAKGQIRDKLLGANIPLPPNLQ